MQDILMLAAGLRERGEPFALATVVRCERPTSAKPGAKALIRPDGRVAGWVGGACAEPVVAREALAALRDGQPRLVVLVGDGGRDPARTEGIVHFPMTCHSGGTLEIYVEPFLPKALLVLVGHGPVIETLATLGETAGHAVSVLTGDATAALRGLSLGSTSSVVVATHGDDDEQALTRVLATPAGYVSLVASRKRASAIVETLRQRGVPAEQLARLKAPAGLDIGAVTPEEIAVSILAEIIQARHHRPAEPAMLATALAEAKDPICGMTVEVATARHQSDWAGRSVYFCCRHCKETFDAEPARYAAALAG
ncbi:MAG TPA: XdhC family protein [Methylomirabilota bacterium]|nr:XdhC family protein [Methylomirabilota bacterium]